MGLRVGIIGLGVGEAHIQGYQSHSACEVTALCDFDEEKLSRAGKKYPGLRLTKGANDILEDPEVNVVSIASYDNHHFEHIMQALAHNKHVFVEKPLCLFEHEAKQIREALKQKPQLKISSNLILRRCPRFRSLKQLISEGKMGQTFHVEGDYNYGRFHKITNGWRGEIDFYSVVYGGGVHIIDLLLWLTNDRVLEVAAYGNRIASQGTQFKYNDTVTAILKFESGMTGKVSIHFACVYPHFHNLAVYGTKATFVNGEEFGRLYNSREAKGEFQKMTEPYPGVHKGDFMHNFIESIEDDREPEVSTEDVFKAMSVCFAIEKAVKSGPCRVNYI